MMKIISFLAFNFVRTLIKISFALFHKKEVVTDKNAFKLQGRPTILVSNHPNTMVDVFHVAKTVGPVSFLANAGLFKNKWIGKILRILHGIPVERPQDVEGRMINNKNVFKECDDFLANGGCLYIAPEGSSFVERRLRRIKSGTARIGLSAEKNNNFSLGLQILPVGVTYSDYYGFRTDVLLNVGEPIMVKDFQEAYEVDSFKTAKSLTAHLQTQLKNLVLHTDPQDEDVDEMVIQIEKIYNYSPTNLKNFNKSKDWIQKLIELKNKQNEKFETLKAQIHSYFKELEANNLNNAILVDSKLSVISILKVILMFPIFIWGFINNMIPLFFPAFLSKKIKIYHGYISTLKIVIGIFSFLIFYFFQIKWINAYFDNVWITIIYASSLIPTGLIAWDYAKDFKKIWKKIIISTSKSRLSSVILLQSKRKRIIESIDSVN